MELYGAIMVLTFNGHKTEHTTLEFYSWANHYLILLGFCDSKDKIVEALCRRKLAEMSRTLLKRLVYFKEKLKERIAARREADI
jgi:hypothetical protein